MRTWFAYLLFVVAALAVLSAEAASSLHRAAQAPLPAYDRLPLTAMPFADAERLGGDAAAKEALGRAFPGAEPLAVPDLGEWPPARRGDAVTVAGRAARACRLNERCVLVRLEGE